MKAVRKFKTSVQIPLVSNSAFQALTKTSRFLSQDVPQIPNCEYEPKKYTGPTYEQIKKIKDKHLITPFGTAYKEPLLLHDGKMQWLFDHTGKRYLDVFGGIVTVSVGHCHPKVNEAAIEQMKSIWHTTNIYLQPRLHEYAEKLASKFPGDLKVVYLVNSGTEANDLAILLARLYTKNLHIISLRNSYHGVSAITMGVTALSTWKHNIPVSPGLHHAMNPDVYNGLWGGLHCRDSPVQTTRHCDCKPPECKACGMYYDQLEEIFKYSLPTGKVAAFLVESIQGVGGVVQFPKGYLKKVFELVRLNGGVCIADEVQTGFGRTGEHYWGFEMHGVMPDIVTMAKGIGNGYPMGAVVTTPAIADSLKQALFFNTFGGNPVASAVGLAVLQVIEEEKMQENAHMVGTYFLKKLSALRDQFDCVGDVRGKGLMIGVEMVTDSETREPLPAKQFVDIWEECKNMGVLLGRGGMFGNVFRLKPPMCFTKEDADFTVNVLQAAIEKHIEKQNKTVKI
ncbi:alanine--glyoxylate aminotransferase 2, mitochondrial isoform X1 [Periplaneta americana]|uniref:alanine--glyoxylate aminotransferase 2, mitochondrial isoform X1 n=1 Tax=Periplaneta americana TaxID=6978 RepID=UPI0037E7F679